MSSFVGEFLQRSQSVGSTMGTCTRIIRVKFVGNNLFHYLMLSVTLRT